MKIALKKVVQGEMKSLSVLALRDFPCLSNSLSIKYTIINAIILCILLKTITSFLPFRQKVVLLCIMQIYFSIPATNVLII